MLIVDFLATDESRSRKAGEWTQKRGHTGQMEAVPTHRSKQRKGCTWGEEGDEESKSMSVDYEIGGTIQANAVDPRAY